MNNENREVIRSHEVYSYAEKPAMHAHEIAQKVVSYIQKDTYDFICANFANADMLGHTGNFNAAKKAIGVVDIEVKRIVDAVLKKSGEAMIIGDHGNAEEMIDIKTGEMLTEHTRNPVPCIVIRRGADHMKLKKGRLADVAPTLLSLMGIKKPKEMSGKIL